MLDYIDENVKTPVVKKVDVVVVGGGPAGFGAGVAAARNGAETLLIERYAFLGGMLTTGLVRWLPIWLLAPLEAYNESKPLQGGVVTELINRLVEVGGAIDPAVAHEAEVAFEAWLPTDHEIDKVILVDMLEKARADILLHSLAVDVVREENEVKGVIIESKSGRQAILANVVVDASGDADMAAKAGAQYQKFEEPLMMSLIAFLANVDVQKAVHYSRKEGIAEFSRLVDQAIQNGDLVLSEKKVLPGTRSQKFGQRFILDPKKIPENWCRRGEAGGWIESVSGDCTNVQDLTRAELATRKAILPTLRFLRRYVPGYENSYLAYSAPQIGVRESRRVLGQYLLTADGDIANGLKHEDAIVKCRTADNSDKSLWPSGQVPSRDLTLYTPKLAPIWDIPYRCIVPSAIDGLLVAGRCISIDHKAATLFTPRDIATCICLGQAAGTAAALSIRSNVKPRDLNVEILRKTLTEQGANLD